MPCFNFNIIERDLFGIPIVHDTLTHSFECEISFLLNPYVFFEFTTKH